MKCKAIQRFFIVAILEEEKLLNSKIPMGVIAGLDQETYDNCGEPIPPKSEEWIATYGKQAAIGALNEFR